MKRIPSLLRRVLPALALCAAAIAPGIAQAAYPEQPIKMVDRLRPGRRHGHHRAPHCAVHAEVLGQQRVVRGPQPPGAGGGIGFTELTNARPDGYTIGFINTPNVLTIPIERKSTFHWEKYDLLGNVVDDPGNFSVHRRQSDQEPGRAGGATPRPIPAHVTYGTTGIGSDDHLAAMMFERAAGVKLTHVPFKGAAEVHNAVAEQADHGGGDEHRRGAAVPEGRHAATPPGPDEREALDPRAERADLQGTGLQRHHGFAARHRRAERPAARRARATGQRIAEGCGRP